MSRIAAVLLRAALTAMALATAAWSAEEDVALSTLHNTFVALTTRRELTIAVVGNSVTAGAPAGAQRALSFWEVAADWFRARFPDAQVRTAPAIIYAIGPEVQVFRLDEKVLAQRPDLVIAEFAAANGAYGEAGRMITEPAAEGWVRRLRWLAPECDCLLNLALFRTMMDDHRAGRVPPAVAFLTSVGAAYGCAIADSQAEIARRLLAGEPWDRYMSDVIHPSAAGYAVHADVVTATLEREWRRFAALPASARTTRVHPLPAATTCGEPWQYVRLAPAALASSCIDLALVAHGRWRTLEGSRRGACGVFDAGAGRVVGWYLRSTTPAGHCEVSADGGPWTDLPPSTEPRFTEQDEPDQSMLRQFFAPYGLPETIHRLAFRVAEDGAAVQIAGFFVVERPVHGGGLAEPEAAPPSR